MRKSVLLASIAIATAVPVSLAVPSARAAESTGLEWADKRIKWQGDVARLTLRIRDYQLSPRYCKPTHPKDKTFDEVSLNQLEEELSLLTGDFAKIEAGTRAATQGTSGSSLTTDRLMSSGYPKYRNYDVTDDRHWTTLRRDHIDEARRVLADKRAKLAKAPEDHCGGTESKTTGVIGGQPPVVPAEPPIPAPTFLPVNVPPRPPRFCSIDEKFSWLTALSKQREDMIENEKRAWTWAQALQSGISAKRRDAATLAGLRNGALAQRDAYLAMYRQAEKLYVDVRDNMEVEKCGGEARKEIGSLPGNNGVSIDMGAGVGEIKIPRKPYVALEDGGSLRLGVAQVTRTEAVTLMLLAVSYDVDFLMKLGVGESLGLGHPLNRITKLFGGLEMSDVTMEASGGSVATTTEGVGIPGTGDPGHPSPAGYFLANPAFNDVVGIDQRFETRLDDFQFGIAEQEYYKCWSGTVALGGRIGRLDTSDSFSGSIPGYGRDFAYQTDLETAIWGLFVATEAELSLDDQWDQALRYAGEFSGFRVTAGARAGVNFLSADGTDRLDFTGFAPQSVGVSKDDTTFGYRLNVGVNYTPPGIRGLTLSVGATYGQDDIHPVAKRSGEVGERTQIEFQNQDMFTGTIRTKFTF